MMSESKLLNSYEWTNHPFMLVDTIVVFNNSVLHFFHCSFCAEVQKMEGDTLDMQVLPQQK